MYDKMKTIEYTYHCSIQAFSATTNAKWSFCAHAKSVRQYTEEIENNEKS
jgi:hypothetical protein